MDTLSDHGIPPSSLLPMHILTTHFEAEISSNFFQIRPFKEFMASKGRDRLLSLSLLSHLVIDDSLPPSSDPDAGSPSRPSNAYDFMRLRRSPRVTGDPTALRWNASVRLTNFASVDSSPLCVSLTSLLFCSKVFTITLQLASIGALLDYIVRERALSDFDDKGIGGLDIRDIELLSLSVLHERIQLSSWTSLQE